MDKSQKLVNIVKYSYSDVDFSTAIKTSRKSVKYFI